MKVNNNYKKLAIAIVGISVIVIISIIIYTKIFKPKPITEIKKNIVYISGYYKEYPNDDDPRFYIEFKDDGTFILMYDDSRRSQEDYGDDGAGYSQNIRFHIGKYKMENGNYLIKPTNGARVVFKDSASVDKGLISFYKEENYEQDSQVVGMIVCKLKNGQYMLGAPTEDKKSYRKDIYYYLLYNKPDIKKLPSSVEEFRKQFKMDKKAEQERLAEQKRLAEQSQQTIFRKLIFELSVFKLRDYDIQNATKNLFSTGDSTAEQINAVLSDLGKSFRAGVFHPNLEASWRAKLKEEAKELDVINMFGIKRPKSIDDKTWERYHEDVTAKVLLLEKQGWPIESIKEFGKYFKEMLGRKGQSSNMSEAIASCYRDTQIVGTKVFDNMWYAWKADRISASESKKKLSVLMKIAGMDKLDEKSSADQLRAVADKINKKMKPDDKFWGSLTGTVEKAYYPSGMKGDLGKQLHLFRYVISYQQAKYIVDNYKGRTDEEKLINYIVKEKIWNWTEEESTRLHLKSYNYGEQYPY